MPKYERNSRSKIKIPKIQKMKYEKYELDKEYIQWIKRMSKKEQGKLEQMIRGE